MQIHEANFFFRRHPTVQSCLDCPCTIMSQAACLDSPKRPPIYHFDHSVWTSLSSFLDATDVCNLLETGDTILIHHLSRSVRFLSFGNRYFKSLIYPVSFAIGQNLATLELPTFKSTVEFGKCLGLISLSNQLTSLCFDTLIVEKDCILVLPPSLTALSIKDITYNLSVDFYRYFTNHPALLPNGAKLVSLDLGFQPEPWRLAQVVCTTLLSSCVDTLERLDLNCEIEYDLSQHRALKNVLFGRRIVDYTIKLAPPPHAYSLSFYDSNLLDAVTRQEIHVNELVVYRDPDDLLVQEESSKMDLSHLTFLTRLTFVEYGWSLALSKLVCAPSNHLVISTEYPLRKIVNLGSGSITVHSKCLDDPQILLSKCQCKNMQDLSKFTSIRIRMDDLNAAKNLAKKGCSSNCDRYDTDPMDPDILAPSRFPVLKTLFVFTLVALYDALNLETFIPHHLQLLSLSVLDTPENRALEITWLPPGLQKLVLHGFTLSSRLMHTLPFNLMTFYLYSQGGHLDLESFIHYELRHSRTQLFLSVADIAIQIPLKEYQILHKVFCQYEVTMTSKPFDDRRYDLLITSKDL